MRFKSMFWILNVLVLLSLVLATIATFIFFDRDYVAFYWRRMWAFTAFFILLIGILDYFFIRNWRLFDLLGKEDWPTLLACLEEYIYVKGKLNKQYANLLINTALSVSNVSSVRKLESEVRHKKAVLFPSLGVALGIPLVLEQNNQAIAEFYKPLADNERTLRQDLARWCCLDASTHQDNAGLIALLNTKDLSVRLLALGTLDKRKENLCDEESALIDKAKIQIRSTLSGNKGELMLRRSRESHLLTMVLASHINMVKEKIL